MNVVSPTPLTVSLNVAVALAAMGTATAPLIGVVAVTAGAAPTAVNDHVTGANAAPARSVMPGSSRAVYTNPFVRVPVGFSVAVSVVALKVTVAGT